jgi:hypothetical protein
LQQTQVNHHSTSMNCRLACVSTLKLSNELGLEFSILSKY